jgi:hypothetical protein
VSHSTPSRHGIETQPISGLRTGRTTSELPSPTPLTTQYASTQHDSARSTGSANKPGVSPYSFSTRNRSSPH